MTTEEILKKVKLIEFKAKRRVNSFFLGEYKSSFKGIGMTFSEIRQYQFGDDIKKIDWNTTARYNEPYVKVFEEEREMISIILVDISASMNFGTRKQFKNELCAEISAILALSAIKNNDKVGLILFSDKIELFLPPQKGNSQAVKIIKNILESQPKKSEVNMKLIFDFLLKNIKRKSSVFVISDFDVNNFERDLSVLTKKHDVTGIRIYDEIENNFPDIGFACLKDLETEKTRWINTASLSGKKHYAKYYNQLLSLTKNAFIKNGADFLNISTQKDYMKILFNYFRTHR